MNEYAYQEHQHGQSRICKGVRSGDNHYWKASGIRQYGRRKADIGDLNISSR